MPKRTVPTAVVLAVFIAALTASIIIPWVLWEDAVTRWSAAMMESDVAPWLLALVLAALLALDIVLPVPSSIVGVFCGAVFGVAVGALVVGLGLTLGCFIGYYLGTTVGRAGLLRFGSAEEVRLVERFMARYGDSVLLALRALPVLAELSAFVAGVAKIPRVRFAWLVSLGNLALGVVYAYFGAESAATGHMTWALVGACGVPALGLLVARQVRAAARSQG